MLSVIKFKTKTKTKNLAFQCVQKHKNKLGFISNITAVRNIPRQNERFLLIRNPGSALGRGESSMHDEHVPSEVTDSLIADVWYEYVMFYRV